ncbi:helix-turn-helix domain-containing protein [Kitasatospora mediocidica]|uniref:helix-turn-helix domain-containing protein n=1 Tax=Kitasatospora mediocidica TaxID=58352 RepID=UPI00068AA38C|nr:helix-turn-helix transcriptional regulator [Kitasatospora mediocidica]
MTKADKTALPASPAPGGTAALVYRYATRRSSIGCAELPASLGITRAEAQAALTQLVELRLLQPAGRSGDTYAAVNPMSAALQLLSPSELELSTQQQTIDRIRNDMRLLLPLYQEGAIAREEDDGFEVISDLPSVRTLLEKLAAECQSEVLTSQPGGGRDARLLMETATRDRVVLDRGVSMRTLYQHTARFDLTTCDYVQRIVDYGAEVRTTGNGFMRFLVYDRRTAVLSLADNAHGAVVVRVPEAVHFVAQSFDWAWATAEPFPTRSTWDEARSISDDVNKTLLRMLVNGLDDRRIARQLGISLRTCQRRISDLMTRIGARNRLHAGYLICQQGLIEAPDAANDPE